MKKTFLVLSFLGILFGAIASADISCSETMTRTVSENNVIYTAIGTSGAWGASIEDSVSGGCAFPSGSTTYKTVMLSEDGNSKTITISGNLDSCTFNGDYKFGTCTIKNFDGSTVNGTTTQTSSFKTSTLLIIAGIVIGGGYFLFNKK